MKYLISSLIVIAMSFFLVACSSDKSAETDQVQPETHQMTPKAIQVASVSELSSDIDPVCGMKMNDNMIHSAVEYDGKQIGFCNAGCAAKFAENPKAVMDKIHEGHEHQHGEGDHQM